MFKFNVELYPDVGNTYDSLGEAYIAAGQREPAAANYRTWHYHAEMSPLSKPSMKMT